MSIKSWKGKIMVGFLVTAASGLASVVFSKSSISAEPGARSVSSFYDISLPDIDNNEIQLDKFKGKKLLIVNVASRCGYTSQYKKLQELYEKHGDKLEIIAVPCNDFGYQEPGSAEQIKDFCDVNYGVTFSIASKQKIKSSPRSDIYNWLSNPKLNGWNDKLPSWNFCKYIISEQGELMYFFRSSVDPMSKEILSIL
tara:strand:- start:2594 stop:3184 length:591 start_codon:yes stop_codon:yes gene_type:complete